MNTEELTVTLLNGQTYRLPQCNAVFATLSNPGAVQQQIITLFEGSISISLNQALLVLMRAMQEMDVVIADLEPDVLRLGTNPSQADINAFIAKADALCLPMVTTIIDAIKAMLAEANA